MGEKKKSSKSSSSKSSSSKSSSKSSSSSSRKRTDSSKSSSSSVAKKEVKEKVSSTPKAEATSSESSSKKESIYGKKIGYEDMTLMENMTLDGVLQNLEERYLEDLIYTYTSTILVAINPYKRLPIYTTKHVRAYKGTRLGKIPPHIFAIAETAYNGMVQHEENQSVLVSGESGAGKTESTKLILQFLSARTERTSNIEQMVLASVPVLESMGNAKTGRNDNSSRFGKLIKIQFDEDYYIIGSSMSSYLLEKSRLIFQAKGERNFHVFYQMTNGMTSEERAKYSLESADTYNYINRSGCYDVKGVAEDEALKEFREALALFDVNPGLEDQMFRVLASVLHVGNIGYKETSEGCEINDSKSQKELDVVADMLGLDQEGLSFALRHREIKMRTELINKPLTPVQAGDQTNALAKYLYSVLFDWLVHQLNVCTVAEDFKAFIGVLDIFGFEVFELNSFEQFLINFANEKLQQFFNHQIFKLEQAIYEEEQIDWTVIDFKDNQETLDLIEKKRPPGILPILDEESKFPRATDETLIAKLHNNFDKKHVSYAKPRLARTKFVLIHFAGEVDYEITGWIQKNKDELPANLTKVISSSTNMFVAILFGPDDEMPESNLGRQRRERRGNKSGGDSGAAKSTKLDLSGGAGRKTGAQKEGGSKVTLGTQFKNQLQSLMDLLGKTEPFFIRCVKPNPQKIPNNFDRELIYNQLLYAGMLETIRIRRMGYPIRYTHKDFFKRFRVICPEVAPGSDSKKVGNKLATTLGLDLPMQCQIGLTKVFLKQEVANELEDRRNHALAHIIELLQVWWRMVAARGHFCEYRTTALLLQQYQRMIVPHKYFRQAYTKSRFLQRWWRMITAKKQKVALKEAKRKAEEAKRKKEEEERKKRIAKLGKERVEKEEALKAKLAQEANAAEAEKINRMLAGLEEEEKEEEEKEEKKEKKKKKKKDDRLTRTGSIKMNRNEVVEVPINVDGKMVVGLGWSGKQYAMDASCLMFRYKQHKDDVYKFKPRSKDGAVVHKVGWTGGLGLITTMEGSDIHQIDVNLRKLTDKVNTLVFVVTLFTPGANFSEIQDSYVRLIDDQTKKEYCRYTIEASGKETAKIMCKLFRYGYTAWRLKAIGHPSQGRLYKHMIGKVNAFLDPLPPKKSFKVTVHDAKITDVNKRRIVVTGCTSYCEVRFDLGKHKTRVVKKSNNPSFEQSFGSVSGHDTNIEVTLYNKRGFSKNSYLARAVIPIADVQSGKQVWYNWEDEETAQCGGGINLTIVSK